MIAATNYSSDSRVCSGGDLGLYIFRNTERLLTATDFVAWLMAAVTMSHKASATGLEAVAVATGVRRHSSSSSMVGER